MVVYVKFNGKKITQKKAIELVGKEIFEKRVKSLKEEYKNGEYDIYENHSWMDGMSIDIFEVQDV